MAQRSRRSLLSWFGRLGGREEAPSETPAPGSALGEGVASIWREVLGVPHVGAEDDFFSLGGDSLLATQVVARMRERLGIDLPLRALFEQASFAQLLAALEAKVYAGGGEDLPPIQPVPRFSDRFPLSFAQQRLWFLHRLEPESIAYNEPQRLLVEGPLDRQAMERGLSEILRRHELLRTTYELDQDEPVQVVAPAGRCELPLIALDALPREAAEREAGRLASAESRRPFDLARGPVLRVFLFRLSRVEHQILLVLHHIASDSWSMGVLLRELAALYGAQRLGQPSGLPELAVQYVDYALWQRHWFQGDVLERELAYWRSRLADPPPAVLELPTDRPRPAVRSGRGGKQSLVIPAGTVAGIQALCQQANATAFMVLLAAFQLLLSRYAAQDDIALGSPIAGRRRSETEELIGFFVNTLVLRLNLAGAPSFADLVAQAREVTLGAYAHQDLPFEKLVAELRPDRSLSHNPLFQILFVLQNAPLPTLALADLVLAPLPVSTDEAKFDLTLSITEGRGDWTGTLEYAAELFDPTSMARLCEHLGVILEAVVEHPGAPIDGIALASAAERQQLVAEWNDTASAFDLNGGILRGFAAQCERTPEQPAVIFEGETLTYGELDRRSNQLARWLTRAGVRAEVLVGLAVERGFEMIVGLLGIWKAGGAYVPLDPDHPADRLALLIEDAAVPVLLTQERILPRLPPCSARTLRLDADWPEVAGESDAPLPESEWLRDGLAYVIYTSGSTGRPKGSMNSHGAIANRMWWMQQVYGLTERDRMLQKTPFSFDVSVWELFCPLITGAPMVLARPGGHRDSAYLARLIREQGVTVAHFVPSLLRYFVAEPEAGLCTSLRQVVASGEALPSAVSKDFAARLPGAALDNLYGPTETAIEVSAWRFQGDTTRPSRPSVPIGLPIANVRLHVFDVLGQAGQPAPIGIPGELYIGGVAPGRGYFHRPDWTAERFVPDPLAVSPGERLYRTGDLVRRLPGGEIEFLGRIDHQVKVRGFRIELGEIEAALRREPEVAEAVVIAEGRGAEAEPQLVACLVLAESVREGGEAVIGELRERLRRSLPEPMVPVQWVPFAAFPLLASGKIDRRALSGSLESDWSRAMSGYVAPRTPMEQALAGIWSELLGVEQVGALDDFFALGGHSLLATQMVSRVRERLEVEIPVRQVFEHRNVASLALAIEDLLVAQIESLSEEEAARLLGA